MKGIDTYGVTAMVLPRIGEFTNLEPIWNDVILPISHPMFVTAIIIRKIRPMTIVERQFYSNYIFTI